MKHCPGGLQTLLQMLLFKDVHCIAKNENTGLLSQEKT